MTTLNSSFTPLHELLPGPVATAGRLAAPQGVWCLHNALASVPLANVPSTAPASALCRVDGDFDGRVLTLRTFDVIHEPSAPAPPISRRDSSLADALTRRARAIGRAAQFFANRGFLRVDTPQRVSEPGTDIYLEPLRVQHPGAPPTYLHTSPEFAMKQLLCCGFEKIWQLCHVWRAGEFTPLHNAEFTILEWYRAWEPLDAILDDLEALMRTLLGDSALVYTPDTPIEVDLSRPFKRLTMRQLVQQACGFDLLDALDAPSLLHHARQHELLSPRSLARAELSARWDELFFELQVTHLDPYLAHLGAVFVTHWPAQLAALARPNDHDPRLADRFELYVGGVEIANGFDELCDPHEQRRRFELDRAHRRALDAPDLPAPHHFIEALRYGMPPCAGVAVGFDRVLMLANGAPHIREVLPWAPPPFDAPHEHC